MNLTPAMERLLGQPPAAPNILRSIPTLGIGGGIAEVTFNIQVKTDNIGTSNDDQFLLAQDPTLTYNCDYETSDGQTGTITTNTDFLFTFPGGAGTYTIKLGGVNNTFPRVWFNNAGDDDKLIRITNWGDITWQSFDSAFRGCSNLTSTTSGPAPDLSNVTTMHSMFRDCLSVTSLYVANWDTSNVVNMGRVFRTCPLANPDVTNWNTSNATNFERMFLNSTLADPNTSGWDWSQVTNADAIMEDSGFTTASYDILLVSLDAQTLQPSVIFGVGNVCYSAGGPETARDNLITQDFWLISDDGSCLNGNEWEGTISALYSVAGNWALGHVPLTTEVPLFTQDFINPCNIDIPVDVEGIDIQEGYTSTVTQNAGQSIVVGSASIFMSAGAFVSGDSAISVDSHVAIHAGTFTSTSDKLTIGVGNLIDSGSGFIDNGGEVLFDGNAQRITHTMTFATLTINNGNPNSGFLIDEDITVLTLLDSISCRWNLNDNDIFLEGDYIGTATGDSTPTDGALVVTGTGIQEIFNNKVGGVCKLPGGLRVNKTDGNVTLFDIIEYFADSDLNHGLQYVQGTVVYNTGVIIQPAGFNHTVEWVKGVAPTIPHIRFDFFNSLTNMILNSDFQVDKKDDLNGGGLKINGNEFDCLGDFDHNRAFSATTNDVLNVGGNFHWINGSSNAITGQWFLNVVGNATADNVNVQDNNASGGNTVEASNSIDSGNNDNWHFASLLVTNALGQPALNALGENIYT